MEITQNICKPQWNSCLTTHCLFMINKNETGSLWCVLIKPATLERKHTKDLFIWHLHFSLITRNVRPRSWTRLCRALFGNLAGIFGMLRADLESEMWLQSWIKEVLRWTNLKCDLSVLFEKIIITLNVSYFFSFKAFKMNPWELRRRRFQSTYLLTVALFTYK